MVQCFDPASISQAVEHCLIHPFLFTTTYRKLCNKICKNYEVYENKLRYVEMHIYRQLFCIFNMNRSVRKET